MIHLLHHAKDPRFGTVDVILDATFDSLNLEQASPALFTIAKKMKRSVGVIQRQLGGMTYFTYAPGESGELGKAVICALVTVLGQPLAIAPTVQLQDDRY